MLMEYEWSVNGVLKSERDKASRISELAKLRLNFATLQRKGQDTTFQKYAECSYVEQKVAQRQKMYFPLDSWCMLLSEAHAQARV
jgi:cell fate (sporulation/competence/biofilm development) regulator YlbF (YheA/YmcA/DUF963 family)